MISKQFKFEDKILNGKILKNKKQNFVAFKANLTLKIKVKVKVRDLYVINTWFRFEGKIENASKVIVFTRNHTDADDDRRQQNQKQYVSPQPGGRHNYTVWIWP